PESGLARESRQVVDSDVEVQRHAPHAAGNEEIPCHLESHHAVAVDQIRIQDEVRPLRAIAANGGPHEVSVKTKQALLGRHAAEICAVKASVDDVAAATVADAVAGRDADVHVYAERHPSKNRVDGDLPAILRGGKCRRAEAAEGDQHRHAEVTTY